MNRVEEQKNIGGKGFGHYIALIMIAIAVVIYLIPIYWIVATSLKSPGDIATRVPKFLFRMTLDNYRKLMPPETPGITYIFLIEAFVGILLPFLPLHRLFKHSSTVQRLPLVYNSLFFLTCLYAIINTGNYNFLMLVLYGVGVYWLISKTTTDMQQIRFFFVNAGIFAVVALCLSLAHGGSKYFHQLLNSIIVGVGSTGLAVGLGTFAAYAFSRFKVAGKEDLLFFILSTRMLPPVVVVIPIYLMYKSFCA